MNNKIILLANIDRIKTTQLGVMRIKRNLSLNSDDVVGWCKQVITSPNSKISRKGKNWYIENDFCIITVNASSYTIITAHMNKN